MKTYYIITPKMVEQAWDLARKANRQWKAKRYSRYLAFADRMALALGYVEAEDAGYDRDNLTSCKTLREFKIWLRHSDFLVSGDRFVVPATECEFMWLRPPLPKL